MKSYTVENFVDIVDSILTEVYTDAESKEDLPLQVSTLIIGDKIRVKLGLQPKNDDKIVELYNNIMKEKEFTDTVMETVVDVKDKLNKLSL